MLINQKEDYWWWESI